MQGTHTLWKINTLAFLVDNLQFQTFCRALLSVLLCSCRAHTAFKRHSLAACATQGNIAYTQTVRETL
jgi:hypothetical protein